MSRVKTIEARTPEEMHAVVHSYLTRGFMTANQTPQSVMLVKKKEFSIVMLLIGLFLFILPMFIYLFIYALKKDQYVEVRLVSVPAPVQDVVAEQPPLPPTESLGGGRTAP